MEDRSADGPKTILRPGENCWVRAHADRLAWLIDGADYFAALKRALLAAREQVFIVGWSFDSRILLDRRDPMEGVPDRLRDLLVHVAEKRPSLSIRILVWDYTLLFATDREPLPALTIAWTTPRNVRLVLDDCVPFGAAHHGKFVVIDDRLAFVGGIDVTAERWDTPEHRTDEPHRVDRGGIPYPPHHDVQVAFDGAAAAAVGALARERWRIATGRRVAVPSAGADPWPAGLSPDLRDVEVGIARTEPRMDQQPEIREVERLYLDSIAAARDLIFIENQYFTSESVTAAIERRLTERDGPEVVMVVPVRCSGWLEEMVMDARRAIALRRLEAVDRHRRLRVIAPTSSDEAKNRCNVHAKVMIVDDRLVRIGSANLNNRSMGLDTELDVAVEDDGSGRLAPALALLRNRLLAEHCRVDTREVAEAHAGHGSLVAAIDALANRHDPPAIQRVEPGPEKPESAPLLTAFADPERPVDAADLAVQIIPEELRPIRRAQKRSHVLMALGGLALLVALAALWRYTPLSELTSPETLAGWMETVRRLPLAPVYAVGAFVVLGLVSFPVTVLIGATAVAFGPIEGFVYATTGAAASAAAGFGIGFYGGRRLVRRIAGRRIRSLDRMLRDQGVLAVAMLHALPIAPFSVVNVALGASQVRFLDYLIGTLIGMLPGIIVLAALGDRIGALLRQPTWTNLGLAIGLLVGWIALSILVQRVLVRWRGNRESKSAAAA